MSVRRGPYLSDLDRFQAGALDLVRALRIGREDATELLYTLCCLVRQAEIRGDLDNAGVTPLQAQALGRPVKGVPYG